MEYFISLMVFTFVSSVTPGPNNIMLFASGVNHGIKKSLPHYFGICGGFVFLVACVGFGLGALFKQSPLLHQILQIVGALYLVYFAWKIANSKSSSSSGEIRNPITFFEAALFQWINPKAWVMAIGSVAAFTIQTNIVSSIAMIIGMYFIMGLFAMGIWLTLGVSLQSFLNSNKRQRIFNITMAILLLISIIPIISSPIK
jgi:threonine/homoserine/homoserine lactone efflux protein